MSTGLDNYDASTVPLCHSCLNGKQQRDPFLKSTNFQTTKLLELIHSDLCGLSIHQPIMDFYIFKLL